MIYPSKRSRDWYLVDAALGKQIGQAPMAKILPSGVWEIHRSHLTLLKDVPEVARILDAPPADMARRDAVDAMTASLGYTLRGYQHAGIEFIRRRRGTLLADSPRVGKTLTSMMSHDEAMGKLVCVVPLPTREVWLGWLRRCFPDTPIGVMVGKTYDPIIAKFPIVVGHYDILHEWQSFDPIGTLILDEAHVLSNRSSRRVKAASMLASRAERVIAVTGTPLWNKPAGLWPILATLCPTAFGTFYEFANRYCDPQVSDHGTRYEGSSNELELMTRLSEVMIRREWQHLTEDLPSTSRDLYLAELNADQRFEVELAAEALRDPAAQTNTAGLLARYRKVLGDIKAKTALEAAKTTLDRGEPLVLWAWHKSVAKLMHRDLVKRGYEAFLVHGDIPQEKREAAFAGWRASAAGVLVITISVGQVGIDLSHARIAIFAEIDFTPALVAQAEMRVFSPKRSMHIIYVVADHAVDRRIIEALRAKLDTSDRIGVPAAEAAIDVLKAAFGISPEAGDVDRLMRDLLASGVMEG